MKKQIGFTLIELMVSLVVITTTVAIAVPAFQALLERKSIEAAAQLFERSLKLARDVAITKNTTAQMEPEVSGKDWSQGWVIKYIDPSDGALKTLRSFEPLPGSPTFSSETLGTAKPITIDSTGQADLTGNIDLQYSGCTGNQRIQFQLLISGIMKKGKIACL